MGQAPPYLLDPRFREDDKVTFEAKNMSSGNLPAIVKCTPLGWTDQHDLIRQPYGRPTVVALLPDLHLPFSRRSIDSGQSTEQRHVPNDLACMGVHENLVP